MADQPITKVPPDIDVSGIKNMESLKLALRQMYIQLATAINNLSDTKADAP